jgi:hypothetical protein
MCTGVCSATCYVGGTGTDKFVKVDDENYIKEAVVVLDGYILQAGSRSLARDPTLQ